MKVPMPDAVSVTSDLNNNGVSLELNRVGWRECTITLTVPLIEKPVRLLFGYPEALVGEYTTGVHTITKTDLLTDTEYFFMRT